MQKPLSELTPFPILYEDDDLVAISKPCGILVHRTSITEDRYFVLQLLRDQIDCHIYPVHRLDRATSGVLIFGKTERAARQIGLAMQEKKIIKKYRAIIRGWVEDDATIDYPLAPLPDKPKQEAITHYKRLSRSEMNFSVGKYPTSRYSMVEVTLDTGRRHQIRRHFSHLRHPIINDRRHGDVKHNNYFRHQLGIERMLLHAHHLSMQHPIRNQQLDIIASIPPAFIAAIEELNLQIAD